jgi:hypothetical protein
MSNSYHWDDRISANVDGCHQAAAKAIASQSREGNPAPRPTSASQPDAKSPIEPILLATTHCRGTGSRYLTPRPWDVVTVLMPGRKWSRM